MATVRFEEGSVPYVEGDWDEVWRSLAHVPLYAPSKAPVEPLAERVIKKMRAKARQQRTEAATKTATGEPLRPAEQIFVIYRRPVVNCYLNGKW